MSLIFSNILRGQTINQTLHTDGCIGDPDNSIDHLEHTQVHISLQHQKRGDLSINLYSPAGTRSEVLSIRPLDESTEGIEYTFMTVHNWGENPEGDWTLSVTDNSDQTGIYNVPGDHHKVGTLQSWSLTLWGYAGKVDVDTSKKRLSQEMTVTEPAHEVEEEELEHIMATEERSSEQLHIEKTIESSVSDLTDEDLQLLSEVFEGDEDESSVRGRGHQHLNRRTYGDAERVDYADTYDEQVKRMLADMSSEDQRTLWRILDDKPVSPLQYRRFLNHLDQRVQEEHERHHNLVSPGVNLQQRSLLDKALAQILPPKVEKKAETTTTTSPQDKPDGKEMQRPNKKVQKYRDIIYLINSILPLLDENGE